MKTSSRWVGLTVVMVVIVLDQLSKIFFANESRSLNQGIALGLATGWGEVLMVAGLVLTGYWWWRHPTSLGLALVLGGGVSNGLDRWRLGGVVDWLPIPGTSLHNNLADYAVVLGLIWWVWQYERKKNSHD